MYLYARFLGYKGSITDCDLWSKEQFKKRNRDSFKIIYKFISINK